MTRPAVRLDAAAVRAAARRIRPYALHTPLLTADGLPRLLLKAEHLQRSGSFKLRGAANALLARSGAEVVAGSSGNHGIAVAVMGRRLGMGVTVVMAAGASPAKTGALHRLGARVVHVDGGVSDRDRYAHEYAVRTGAVLVPSSDSELVVAGQGTVGLEVLEDAPEVEALYVPTGGGGLLAGACLAAAGSTVRIVGVEPVGARRYARSLSAGRPVSVPPPDTIADGLRGQRPGAVPYPIVRRRVDDLVSVTDEAIVYAMHLLHGAGIPAEPSGSVALAGALGSRFRGIAAVVVSGGNGVLSTPDHRPQQRGRP